MSQVLNGLRDVMPHFKREALRAKSSKFFAPMSVLDGLGEIFIATLMQG